MAEVLVALLPPLDFLLLKLGAENHPLGKIRQLNIVREIVSSLKFDVHIMLAILKGAEAEGIDASVLACRFWVEQIRDIGYEALIIVDELNYQLEINCLISVIAFIWRITQFKINVEKICQIKKRIHNILSIKEVVVVSPRKEIDIDMLVPDLTSSSSAEIVGFLSEKAEIVARLLDERKQRQVIALWGMVGVGKTALMHNIFKDMHAANDFDCCIWVSCWTTRNDDLVDILKSLMMAMHMEASVAPSYNFPQDYLASIMVDKIREFLREKRYIVFLDDVWTTYDWSVISYLFPKNDLGSRIVLTTRSLDLARECANYESVVALNPLAEEDALNLLCQKVQQQDSSHLTADHKLICRSIVTRCGRLPLAIVSIGKTLLTNFRSMDQWSLDGQSFCAEWSSNVIDTILRGYKELPVETRLCFLYLGMFPANHEIARADIIRKWMDEGFIFEGYLTDHSNLTTEELACNFIEDFAQRSLIQVVNYDHAGQVRVFKVHEVIHEVILRRASPESFTDVESLAQPRWLADYPGKPFQNCFAYWNVQSLFLHRTEKLPDLKLFSPFMRVLSLYGVKLDSFPSYILELKRLRHLCLRRTGIRVIPKSISKLERLQTLDLKQTNVTSLPKEILKLKGLIHLLVSGNIDGQGMKLPYKVQKWTLMKKLCLVNLEDGGKLIENFGTLTNIKRLCVTNLRSGNEVTFCHSISKMDNLQSLSISSLLESNEIITLDAISPSTVLGSLKITGPLTALPKGIASWSKLAKIHLKYAHLKEDPFGTLQTLRFLLELRLLDEAYDGDALQGLKEYGFLGLHILHIENCSKLKRIDLHMKSMPILKIFKICGCELLQSPPFGIEYLSRLEEIQFPSSLCETLRLNRGALWHDQQAPLITEN